MVQENLYRFRNGWAGVAVFVALLFGWSLTIQASTTQNATAPGAFDHGHSLLTQVLQKHVKMEGPASTVAYGRLKEDSGDLDRYLSQLEKVTLDEFQTYSRNEQLAFLINAYNAYTVKLILDHYPLKSIKDIGSPWKKKFFTLFGKERHLDDVEHGMIRQDRDSGFFSKSPFESLEKPLQEALKPFNEPRIHFAVNCASIGCPALMDEAFVASKVNSQLKEATRLFLQDKTRNIFDADEMELRLSKIFDWYGKDFEKASGSVQEFVAPVMGSNPEEVKKIRATKKISFLDYDWGLNEH